MNARVRLFLSQFVVLVLLGALLAACGSAAPQPAAPAAEEAPAEEAAEEAPAEEAAAPGELVPVSVQLKWVPQAQFAGYYAAKEQGFYEAEGLDVTILPGGPDIVPEQVVASGEAEFGLNWLASLLAVREQGTPLINIAQIYTYGGMRQLAWNDSGIETPEDLRGRRVAVWFGGNEYNLLATLNKYDINPDTDVELVAQPFDMNLLLNREVDSAAAMTYNELYQVLSAGHTIEELNILDFNAEGTAMLEDGIFTREDWLNEPGNMEVAAKFVDASIQGWEYCRDNASDCVDYMLANDVSGVMTREAQQWQMDEVNKLIWGDPIDPAIQVGYMDPELFARTAETALTFGVIENPASEDAYTHEVWEMATQGE
ncbi:MAG: ABC transporter substrate-binding protein [Chloroflexaceae bacterium]|nr:ABC transporter substrate-binding protein [Chloroflexaceae bacterium]